MSTSDYLLVIGRAAMSVSIIWAVVACECDLRAAYARVKGWWPRALARASASVFLGLVALSEGLHLFNLTTGTLRVPDPWSLLSAAPWAFLCCWTLVVRPFGRYEVLCPSAGDCSVASHAGAQAGHPVGSRAGAEPAARSGLVQRDPDSGRFPLPVASGGHTHAVPVAVRREGP